MDDIKEVISQVISDLSSGKQNIQKKLQTVWDHIADDKTKKHTRIDSFEQDVLVVHVDSPAWLFQMRLKRAALLAQCQAEIPQITAIVFKIGKVK